MNKKITILNTIVLTVLAGSVVAGPGQKRPVTQQGKRPASVAPTPAIKTRAELEAKFNELAAKFSSEKTKLEDIKKLICTGTVSEMQLKMKMLTIFVKMSPALQKEVQRIIGNDPKQHQELLKIARS